MDWKDITGALAKGAPLLASLLGTPAAGAAVAMIESALGVSGADAADQVLQANPDALVKLKQIEADSAQHLQALLVQAEQNRLAAETSALQIAAADRQNARGMQVSTKSAIPAVLAILITLGFFGILGVMLAGVWKPTDNQALLILLGALGTSWGAVVNYYFGSSAESARKNDLLAAAAPAPR